jgi:hypothetical protein
MAELSFFESRYGRISCNAQEAFAFVTDLRNFEQFIPAGTIKEWKAEKEFCSFNVSMLGTVTIRLGEKDRYKKVVFNGDALKKNDFELTLFISDNLKDPADIKITLTADLNPMMKMMAVKPIKQFLEVIIIEMEGFQGWKNVRE